MYVLQELSWPIKLPKIDLMHPFASNSRILIKEDEARVQFSKDAYLKWQSGLTKEQFLERNFNTECFFLAFMSHHLAIMPIINKYQRRIRVIREMNKLIEEIKQTEHLWKLTPLAQRNRYLLEKWKAKVKVSLFFFYLLIYNNNSSLSIH